MKKNEKRPSFFGREQFLEKQTWSDTRNVASGESHLDVAEVDVIVGLVAKIPCLDHEVVVESGRYR
jgi:hypothetical protein